MFYLQILRDECNFLLNVRLSPLLRRKVLRTTIIKLFFFNNDDDEIDAENENLAKNRANAENFCISSKEIDGNKWDYFNEGFVCLIYFFIMIGFEHFLPI